MMGNNALVRRAAKEREAMAESFLLYGREIRPGAATLNKFFSRRRRIPALWVKEGNGIFHC